MTPRISDARKSAPRVSSDGGPAAHHSHLQNWAAVRVFLAVRHTGSFGRAASHLHSSKATISRMIGLLESELGVRLFERHAGLRMSLTPDSELIVGAAERMGTAADEIKTATKTFRAP